LTPLAAVSVTIARESDCLFITSSMRTRTHHLSGILVYEPHADTKASNPSTRAALLDTILWMSSSR
jgi:hypothetical protein